MITGHHEHQKILISGLTAAGKTTHARLVADELGWSYVDIASIRRELLIDRLPRGTLAHPWSVDHDQLRLLDPTIDVQSDSTLGQRLATLSNVVVDAWLQPWLYERCDALRIWLESSLESRSMKAQVSALRRGLPQMDATRELLEKDRFSRDQFRRIYSIELIPDRNLFDIVIDNSNFIEEASIVSSDTGIHRFQQLLMQAIQKSLCGG